MSLGTPTVPTVLNTSNCFIYSNSASGNALSVQQLGAGNVVAFSNASGGSNVFVMNNLGQVGIGTTSPGTLLHVGTGTGTPGSVPITAIYNGSSTAAQFGSLTFSLNDTTDPNTTKYLTFAITGSAGYQCFIELTVTSFGYGDIIDRTLFRFTADASCRSDGSGSSVTLSPISVIGSGGSSTTIIGATNTASTSQIKISFLRNQALYGPYSYTAFYTFKGINNVACTGVSFA
jgi:hypothetical protein